MAKNNKVILAILDGFGIGKQDKATNAIFAANTPFFDKVFKNKHALLSASEEDVGLPKNKFGNSELGHMTIGSGRTIYNLDQQLCLMIEEWDTFCKYLLSQQWVQTTLKKSNVVHICGIYSSGCVHGNLKHINGLIKFFENYNKKVALHLIADGRDTDKNVFLKDIQNLLSSLKSTTKIISISGRYYAMDRDNNLERTNQYYWAMTQDSKATNGSDLITNIMQNYESNVDDEFITPTYFENKNYLISSNDTIIFTNYRADRIKQIIQLFQKNINSNNLLVGMCSYPGINNIATILDKQNIKNTLGAILANHDLKQLRVAETEKFAHVTYFFDGGSNHTIPGCKHILIPSPNVPTYDLVPEMSADKVTQTVIDNLNDYDFIVVNYANADMVGHTGNFSATKKAIEILDNKCYTLYNMVVDKYDGTLIITADHGNADYMIDSKNNIVKTHSIAKVPFLVLSNKYAVKTINGSLQDIAPSILYAYQIKPPKEMTGRNLLITK